MSTTPFVLFTALRVLSPWIQVVGPKAEHISKLIIGYLSVIFLIDDPFERLYKSAYSLLSHDGLSLRGCQARKPLLQRHYTNLYFEIPFLPVLLDFPFLPPLAILAFLPFFPFFPLPLMTLPFLPFLLPFLLVLPFFPTPPFLPVLALLLESNPGPHSGSPGLYVAH